MPITVSFSSPLRIFKEAVSLHPRGIGDLAIWLSLLEVGKTCQRHVILVSEEGKPDWWQKSNGEEFLPRYELVDEFRRVSNGKTVHIIKLSKLLQLFKASTTAIKEAQSVERLNRMSQEQSRQSILLTSMSETGSTNHEIPPCPPLPKGEWGDFHIKHCA